MAHFLHALGFADPKTALTPQLTKRVALLGGLALLLASVFSVGYHQFDEHVQIMEFAGLKLGLTTADKLPWEYHHQLRPSLQPALVVFVYNILETIGLEDPFVCAWLLRLLSAALSFWVMWLCYRAFAPTLTDPYAHYLFVILVFLLWFWVYQGVRFSSDNISAKLFAAGFALDILYQKRPRKTLWQSLLVGLLLGLAIAVRFQVGFMVVGFAAWLLFIRRERALNLLVLLAGIVVAQGLGLLADRWFYGEWVLPAWNYLAKAVWDSSGPSFEATPLWYYPSAFLMEAAPPVSIVLLLSLIAFVVLEPKSPITWLVVPFVLVHFLIPHKELRFLMPIGVFLPVCLAVVWQRLNERRRQRQHPPLERLKPVRWAIGAVMAVNLLFCVAVCFKPADPYLSLYQALYRVYLQPAVLYTIGQNPYVRVCEVNFYKRSSLEVRQIENLAALSLHPDYQPDDRRPSLLATKDMRLADSLAQHHAVVYTTLPAFVRYINVNNWVERSQGWTVLEVR